MINNLEESEKGIALTKKAEGLRLKPYLDSGGIWTCGYGHTKDVNENTVCTEEIAEQWLKQDSTDAVNAVNKLVTVPLTQNEFDALVDFVFNIGVKNFSTSTMHTLLNKGDYEGAAQQFKIWNLCKGKVIEGLINRRILEQNEFNGEK
jgi:lysozyme